MKRFPVLVLLLFSISLQANKKHVIGCRTVGMFSNVSGVINHLAWCKQRGFTPVVYWDSHNPYYQKEGLQGASNVWEYYFEPVSSLRYQAGDTIHRSHEDPDGQRITPITPARFSCVLVQKQRPVVHAIIEEFIKVKPYVQQIVSDFRAQHGMNTITTIGLHIRGTDKHYEAKPFDPGLFFKAANDVVKKYNLDPVQFFVATDEQKILDRAKRELQGKVIHTDAIRSTNGKPVHYGLGGVGRAQLGLDVLTEVLLLTTCTMFVHGCSNVSNMVLYWNPKLEDIPFYRTEEDGMHIHVAADQSIVPVTEYCS